ncbi:LAGLIDADG endonuclease [Candidatus Nitrososphaera evergladensis SR1]|jgi:intein-encoded DNA endonuclease-like protein|uniref:LAGLIDADG endonuclease n=1 Tax=Candidatus Nitrososphaera evergladensis SR1 TaxID=1459636 RepID=A0A075MQA7_9ARCH|nr:LAGLIDADG family homing endonuclease [Candidatus Nitrososphaera evergladensis]AIF83378.1 LAGLIDADG endonuclease [Candidatus Nitrososphaera evergladensis SR1]
MKSKSLSRQSTVHLIKDKFDIPLSTCYLWFSGSQSPHGALGKLKTRENLFYVLGVLLGDGYAYNWQSSYKVGILVKDESFAKKFAERLSTCTGGKVTAYPSRKRNLWFVKVGNHELFTLFKDFKSNLNLVKDETISKAHALQFIEGFFDAEGCVKVVKEKARKTPKICLDFTNTNYEVLEVVQKLLRTSLNIESGFSVQHDKRPNRKPVYHLRIYKKDYIRIFFENMQTIKLNKEKALHLKKWLQRDVTVKL